MPSPNLWGVVSKHLTNFYKLKYFYTNGCCSQEHMLVGWVRVGDFWPHQCKFMIYDTQVFNLPQGMVRVVGIWREGGCVTQNLTNEQDLPEVIGTYHSKLCACYSNFNVSTRFYNMNKFSNLMSKKMKK